MIKLNGEIIDYSLFPNNEIKMPNIDDFVFDGNKHTNTIELIYDNSIDLIRLQFIKRYLDDRYSNTKINLLMKYIPYERMDRKTENQMFTCKYFCQMINDLKFNEVIVLDPHSNVCIGILERCVQIKLENIIGEVIGNIDGKIDYIFFPDNGANKKYTEILESVNIPKIWGNKHRDLNTGEITDYDIIGNYDLKDKNILIVDDICVKGYTTLFASKKLKELGANKVYFYCSHCEDDIYNGKLLKTDYIDKIFTTDSLRFDEHNKIEKLYINGIMVVE